MSESCRSLTMCPWLLTAKNRATSSTLARIVHPVTLRVGAAGVAAAGVDAVDVDAAGAGLEGWAGDEVSPPSALSLASAVSSQLSHGLPEGLLAASFNCAFNRSLSGML